VTFPGWMYLTYLRKTGRAYGCKYVFVMIWFVVVTLLGWVSGVILLINLFKPL